MEDFLKTFLKKHSIDSLVKGDDGADNDFKLLEGNLEIIFCNILRQKLPVENFSQSYAIFLENALKMFAKYQRTAKFITKYLTCIKSTPTVLVKEIILPTNFVGEFSKAVAVASNQQSLALLDLLVNTLDECFNLISQDDSETKKLLLFITSELLISFFKEVKLFAPSIAFVTLHSFIEKLNSFIGTLQRFGTFLFSNEAFMFKNEDIIRTFLELCFYCGEIHTLITCYKDSVLHPVNGNDLTAGCDWQCCITLQQWKKLVKFVKKSKLDSCCSICFQLALQKVRILKLKKAISLTDRSTLKIINHQLSSDFGKSNIFQQISPEDFRMVMEVLTVKQFKSIIKNIFDQTLEISDKSESQLWLSNPALQENFVFIAALMTEILRETDSHLKRVVSEKTYSRISWLGEEYFDEQNSIRAESLERFPEKINALLQNSGKIRKSVSRNSAVGDSLARIVGTFKSLPLPYMGNEFRCLGLSLATGLGVLVAGDESSACVALESVCTFIASDTDASTCFDIGLCIKWLSEICYENNKTNELKMKVIEILVRSSPNTKFGLRQMGEMIDSMDTVKQEDRLKMMETRVLLYNQLGKCWQRAKKRKSDNDDLIGSHRNKLVKMITEEAKDLQESTINPENCNLLLKILIIELNQAIKLNEESEIKRLMEQRFPPCFDFAVRNVNRGNKEPCAFFLTVVLQSVPQLRKFLRDDFFFEIWKALRTHEKANWRLFSTQSTDEEFTEVLEDLLKMSKKFLNSDKCSTNCFEIWEAFFEFSTNTKRHSCQLRLQEFFDYVHDCSLLLENLPVTKKIFLIKFLSFCLTKKNEVTVTSHVLDTIIHVVLECLEGASSTEDFRNLFDAEVNVASAIVLRQFAWSRTKVHLTFVMFNRLLEFLVSRCNAGQQINKDDLIMLSNCALSLEKWVSVIIKKEKDFARTTAYFITALISSIASVTVLPAIKIHLTNCINHFLSITDSHTVAYLKRILKPGFQQVFDTTYSQFKKYHKYSGKI